MTTHHGQCDCSQMTDLFNAAREFINERIDVIRINHFGDYTPEDLESALQEAAAIESQIDTVKWLCAQVL